MMTSDLDIYRSANELIKQHGEDAAVLAAMTADRFLAAGDLGGTFHKVSRKYFPLCVAEFQFRYNNR